MRTSRFAEEQIHGIVREAEAGAEVADVYGRVGSRRARCSGGARSTAGWSCRRRSGTPLTSSARPRERAEPYAVMECRGTGPTGFSVSTAPASLEARWPERARSPVLPLLCAASVRVGRRVTVSAAKIVGDCWAACDEVNALREVIAPRLPARRPHPRGGCPWIAARATVNGLLSPLAHGAIQRTATYGSEPVLTAPEVLGI
jgi:hypothetical protein